MKSEYRVNTAMSKDIQPYKLINKVCPYRLNCYRSVPLAPLAATFPLISWNINLQIILINIHSVGINMLYCPIYFSYILPYDLGSDQYSNLV